MPAARSCPSAWASWWRSRRLSSASSRLRAAVASGRRIKEFEVSLPLLAETTFHGGATSHSWLIGALGAGAVAGGLYAARSARTGVARLTRAALGYAIAVTLLAAAPTFPTAAAACGLAGVATVIFLTTGNATIQLASDPEYRGRVTALWSMALVGTTPIGSPIIGALSDVASPRYALGLGAAACLAAAIIGGWLAAGRRRLFGGPVTTTGSGARTTARSDKKSF
jgi:MFS family permease